MDGSLLCVLWLWCLLVLFPVLETCYNEVAEGSHSAHNENAEGPVCPRVHGSVSYCECVVGECASTVNDITRTGVVAV